MEWLTAIKKSIDFMEAHLLDDISADDVVAEIFMSPFYFQLGFKILTEMTPSEYIRNRRLYLAALDVLGGKEKVIDKNCAWNKAFFLLYCIRYSVLIFYRICCESDFVDDGESVFGVIDFEPHGGEDGGQEDDEDGVDGLEP